MTTYVLIEDGCEWPLTEAVACRLVARDIIYPCGTLADSAEYLRDSGSCTHDDVEVYHVSTDFEHLTNDDLDSLTGNKGEQQ
jgi:hypothetical protein